MCIHVCMYMYRSVHIGMYRSRSVCVCMPRIAREVSFCQPTHEHANAHPLAGNFAWHLGIATQLRLPPGDGMHYSFVINI